MWAARITGVGQPVRWAEHRQFRPQRDPRGVGQQVLRPRMSRSVQASARQVSPQVALRRPISVPTGAVRYSPPRSRPVPSGMRTSTGWSMPSVNTAPRPAAA